MAIIAESLVDHIQRSWRMLRTAIKGFTPEEWRAGDNDELVPARWALHAVETGHYYIQPSPEGFRFGQRSGVNWERAAPHELPSQSALLAYLDEVEEEAARVLRSASDEELLGPNAFPWTGPCPMARMIYLMRHTQHHCGELNMLLRRRGWETDNWA